MNNNFEKLIIHHSFIHLCVHIICKQEPSLYYHVLFAQSGKLVKIYIFLILFDLLAASNWLLFWEMRIFNGNYWLYIEIFYYHTICHIRNSPFNFLSPQHSKNRQNGAKSQRLVTLAQHHLCGVPQCRAEYARKCCEMCLNTTSNIIFHVYWEFIIPSKSSMIKIKADCIYI